MSTTGSKPASGNGGAQQEFYVIVTFRYSLNGKFYRTVIKPALSYGTECWVIKRHHAQKMSVTEMRMLRLMCGNTRRDKVRNEDIRIKIGVAFIKEKMRENRRRCLVMCDVDIQMRQFGE